MQFSVKNPTPEFLRHYEVFNKVGGKYIYSISV